MTEIVLLSVATATVDAAGHCRNVLYDQTVHRNAGIGHLFNQNLSQMSLTVVPPAMHASDAVDIRTRHRRAAGALAQARAFGMIVAVCLVLAEAARAGTWLPQRAGVGTRVVRFVRSQDAGSTRAPRQVQALLRRPSRRRVPGVWSASVPIYVAGACPGSTSTRRPQLAA